MAFKDFLFASTTYPDPTPQSAAVDAVAVAALFDARLAAVACKVKMKVPSSLLGDILMDIPALAAGEEKKSADAAAGLLAAVNAEAQRQGVACETISETCFTMEVPEVLVDYARLHDVTILPVPRGDDVDQWFAESVLFGSGRPTLIMPAKCKRPFRLDTAVVAWDFSKSAARAVADAIPALQKAKRVNIITVLNEKKIDTKRSAVELAKHLAHHRIAVTVDSIDAAGRDIGTTIRSYCEGCEADLMVMGAYGHSRLREFVLGGATRSMLSKPTLPVLMSH